MVAKITTGKSIRGMLHYNENKVAAGEARLILSSGFATSVDDLSFQQKLQRFVHLTELKPSVKTNALHISLNFHSSEQLCSEKLQMIARTYMEEIGFADQPFLVYRHDDAAHQHLHITTTNITAEGERMDLHDIGRRLSEPARKRIEIDFNLVKAEHKIVKQESGIKKAEPRHAKYGKLPTKRAISNVLAAVVRDYSFTSFAEYNAVLKCFNVVAIRGVEHTPMFENKGLVYSILDQKGRQIGVPIKSSAFYSKPTLRNLEEQFEKNLPGRQIFKQEFKSKLDGLLSSAKVSSMKELINAAATNGIHIVLRENDAGQVYGMTYVDHLNKAVFNGSGLGKAYTAKGISEHLLKNKGVEHSLVKSSVKSAATETKIQHQSPKSASYPPEINFLQLLMTKPDHSGEVTMYKRKKKRKKKIMINQEINH